MKIGRNLVLACSVSLASAASSFAHGQVAVAKSPAPQQHSSLATPQNLPLEHQSSALSSFAPRVSWELDPLVNFKDSDIKFNLGLLMATLRDTRHEGWVLAAYPDPKTSRPLIGAGFSLDLPERVHPQRDSLNPHPFLEPSSAQLWEAAGLDPQRLQDVIQQFNRNLEDWSKQRYRRRIRTSSLEPQISEDDATRLLRISAIQAVYNARGYCRYFDQLTGPQQMALSQLVFQMGVNLEEFTQFLSAINNRVSYDPAQPTVTKAEYWDAVQGTLIHSDWARRYSTRAVSVVAMLDPAYAYDPWQAEAKVRAEVHPLHTHRRHAATVRTASAARHKSSARRTHKS